MKKYKVFFTDDQTALRDGLAKLVDDFERFQSCGLAANGAEAIAAFEAGMEADIILLDLSMPVLNGYDTAEWLAANRPSVKIIIMTVSADRHLLPRLLNAGVSGIINKDVSRKELMAALEAVINNEPCFSENILHDLAWLHNPAEKAKIEKRLGLSAKEIEFIRHSATGMTYKAIHDKMGISKNTGEQMRARLFETLQLDSRVAMAMYAAKQRLIEL